MFAVLPTPMMLDGSLDMESLDRVVDHYLIGGAVGLVPVSIAGEGDLLDDAERLRVVRRVVCRSAGRASVVVAVLAGRIDRALAQAHAAANCGATGLLVKPPMGSAQEVLEHVGAIARSVRLPIILLDNPKVGARLPMSLVQALVDTVPQVCGIKLEEEPTAVKMAMVRAQLGTRIRIFGGLGGVHCLHELEHGADGFFTGYPHPELLVTVMDRFRHGDLAGAAAAYEAFLPVAMKERGHAATMIRQRKTILFDCGVIRNATVRMGANSPAFATAQTAGSHPVQC
ncbi:MAG TPA: dihydrodipicolinate synthase family protein [Ideonella sp.]|uniref:dihydrodipicolinate synthase family protein n=1 Tax=Ideonella sp. TaxID=1929293 RepID=UPI002E3361E0|nr:dihydrodipicolinate synthase family protein [Ideonella sp.]HEX5684031.1 dihydrodipicolinate synthase family protein [Ideonella sp.]